jgi:hypothetical protein
MRKPNLFIVGAPKSGTSAMNDFLNQHPEIFMAKKEIHFFGTDLNIKESKLTVQEYLNFFAGGQDKKIIGESSVWYLSSTSAAQEIKKFSPGAKIIIMLRNPLEMLPALHKQNIFDANEDIKDFKEALSAIDDRRHGKRIPRRAELLSCLLYTDAVAYSSQIERYFDAFGRENVLCIIYDDFKKDNLKTYGRVLEFLEVDSSFKAKFSIVNAAKEVQNIAVYRFVKQPDSLSRKLVRIFIPVKSARHYLMTKILSLNIREAKGVEIGDELKQHLKESFREEIEQLGKLLGRELDFWLE